MYAIRSYYEEEMINNRNVVNVELESNVISLDELVVIGYGTVKKSRNNFV